MRIHSAFTAIGLLLFFFIVFMSGVKLGSSFERREVSQLISEQKEQIKLLNQQIELKDEIISTIKDSLGTVKTSTVLPPHKAQVNHKPERGLFSDLPPMEQGPQERLN